ncbi:helix-turn-helix domain containing protein [Microbacterium sp. STN6]|uniref:TetR/AcrR family transcriptional regulator n=1 Tax=Microbacterium sp. STN6 TaxID=2995588 RepID=UPI002260C17A|nr:TetR/AcrR family transcriptional regulator [Microbacterium sp. STN6]MCX7522225.1 helix-turn-helix domain containing protein [Microbacterium sp. STN6]
MAASGTRREQAERTRGRISAAAQQLFLDRGYRATTIMDIAKAADVAHQTVYFTFGSKAALLSAIMDSEIVGDSLAVPLLERPQIGEIARVPDAAERLERIVAVTCDITARLAPLYELVRSGAADEEVRLLLDRHEEQRWRSLRGLVGLLDGELAAHLNLDRAADRLYATLSHEVFWLLVRRRGWGRAQWQEYVAQQAVREILPAGIR